MSEQEKKSGGSAIEGSVMMVEKTPGGRLKQPYRPNELQDNTDFHQKRPRAPIVPSVAEEMKYFTEDCASNENEFKKRKEYEEVSYDKEKQSIAKKFTSNTERREHSPESIILQSTELDRKKTTHGPITPLVQPIPDVQSTTSGLIDNEKEATMKIDDGSITEEIEELQSPEVAKKHSDWSDDEEAGGLPRSDSRASRVSRMVRQFFCCGVSYEAPSEDNISTHRAFGQGI
ncbi:uncharacterized protein LOC125068344 [Vanessa atalanta]|uniref:uncharacterized protein LOC125068344 n=1 Tax=Vanessa atalanta TaxID=42275 RepID=UPI001FCD4208|nr:uncharacterized protein LOC125068344 [Vanessa atalanta]